MTSVQEQFAFVGEIQTAGAMDPPQGFIDTTTRAVPGLIHASIHRRIDGEGIVIYEARTGGRIVRRRIAAPWRGIWRSYVGTVRLDDG
jgi:hypothetical protein